MRLVTLRLKPVIQIVLKEAANLLLPLLLLVTVADDLALKRANRDNCKKHCREEHNKTKEIEPSTAENPGQRLH